MSLDKLGKLLYNENEGHSLYMHMQAKKVLEKGGSSLSSIKRDSKRGVYKRHLEACEDGWKVVERRKNGREVSSEFFEDYDEAVIAFSFSSGHMVTRQEVPASH